ncbi:uncharacterized protein LOC118892162 [Balaenoptera musculus]|uniref:Uncharacterized protein LOC118892162 n=1 Tax=Balaenoptera musculus TaxID=9771 RepID=A0A8B8X2H6_BALMU|nr:uncharacterized protein LOC118892162 [Balaenoptera musculus]
MGVGWGWEFSAYLHSSTCSWLCWAGLYRIPEPRGDPEIGFCPDRGGVWRGPHPFLCSAQIPSSLGALSKPTLLHDPPGAGAGIITAILMVWVPGGNLHTLHAHFLAALPLVLGLGWSLGVAKSCGKPVVGRGVGSPRATQRSRGSVRNPIAQFHTCERAGSGVSLTFGPFEHTCSCLSFPISCRPLPSLHPHYGPLTLAQLTGTGQDHSPPRAFLPLPGALSENEQFLHAHLSSPGHHGPPWKASSTGQGCFSPGSRPHSMPGQTTGEVTFPNSSMCWTYDVSNRNLKTFSCRVIDVAGTMKSCFCSLLN